MALLATANSTTIESLSGTVVTTVATVSTVGLAITLGIATIVPAAWKLLSEMKETEIIKSRQMRITRNFSKEGYIFVFYVLSIVYLLAGFFALLYLDNTAYDWSLRAGTWLSTVATGATIATLIALVVSAGTYSRKDLEKIEAASSVVVRSMHLVCKKCNNTNPLVPNCLNCGESTGFVDASKPSSEA